jgi:hypothetical protein
VVSTTSVDVVVHYSNQNISILLLGSMLQTIRNCSHSRWNWVLSFGQSAPELESYLHLFSPRVKLGCYVISTGPACAYFALLGVPSVGRYGKCNGALPKQKTGYQLNAMSSRRRCSTTCECDPFFTFTWTSRAARCIIVCCRGREK